MADSVEPGILLKHAEHHAAFGAAGAKLGLTPVMTSISGVTGSLGVEGAGHWSRMPARSVSPADLWEMCHRQVGRELASGLAVARFAEPDLPQQWTYETAGEMAFRAVRACGDPKPADPSAPVGGDPLWFRDAAHSDFAPVRGAQGKGVRIAHLDTGFDPEHATCPKGLDRKRQYNFVDPSRRGDATDTAAGVATSPGHGTATLALLASPQYGGAPEADVVAFRVANSVVLFSNSSVAQALDEVYRLTTSGGAPFQVVSMSMGGLASQAWAEAVNALYEAGVFVVTAAGNNYGNLPTRFIVYPARFGRVVAACGVMADSAPYADRGLRLMAGNYGPAHKMSTALAACTPNVPWARLGCAGTWDGDGSGTSSATPQIAAAAARWIGRHGADLAALPEGWMRVEAVRQALFASAHPPSDHQRLGQGRLRSGAALQIRPAAAAGLRKAAHDSAAFAPFRLLAGLGIDGIDPRRAEMLELEALQITQRGGLDEAFAKAESLLAPDLRRLAEAIAAQPEASKSLRDALGVRGQARGADLSTETVSAADPMAKHHLKIALDPPVRPPSRRRLRAYAYDPVLSGRMDGWGLNEAALQVRWEELRPGPVGSYLEVVDVDPASQCAYAPVNLDHPSLVASDGHAPAESNPQFHQQMVYAVASKTIEHFERALGRVALWAPRFDDADNDIRKATFVRRLRIYPHALREENAYYSPGKSALLFGYFEARPDEAGEVLPGGLVFSCLSHDIIAHETTHALLDGLHRYYREAGNPDALAFHEAFSDLVALFQHFTVPEALRGEIAKTRGDLGQRNILGELAVQFGQGTGRRGALRDAIGLISVNDDGTAAWMPHRPSPKDYEASAKPHARGAVLVAAVFDAFLMVYRARSADLIRLATAGTGVLPAGAIPVDLVNRLADEATDVAGDMLQTCIRALDYCPPVDLTFGDYLRALITADRDVAADHDRQHRVALISAFRARGIYPQDARQLSSTTIAWEPPPIPLRLLETGLAAIYEQFKVDWSLDSDRERVWRSSRQAAVNLYRLLKRASAIPDDELAALGLLRNPAADFPLDGEGGALEDIEVHSVRPARRIDAEERARMDLVIEVTQAWRAARSGVRVRGGCTILFDVEKGEVRYLIRKRLTGQGFVGRQLTFRLTEENPLRANYLDTSGHQHAEPFALLHRQLGG